MLHEESQESDAEYGKCRSSSPDAAPAVEHDCSRISRMPSSNTSRNTNLLTAALCVATIVALAYLGGGEKSRYSVPSFTDAAGHNSEASSSVTHQPIINGASRRLWGMKKKKKSIPKPTEEKKSADKSSAEGKAPEALSHSSGSTTKGPPPAEIKAKPPATDKAAGNSAFVPNPWHEDLPEVHDPCRDDPAFHHGTNGKSCKDWIERVGREMLHQARCGQGVGILNPSGEEFKVKDYCKESCGVCGWGPWAENNEYTQELKVLEAKGVNTRVATNHPTPKPSKPPSKEPTPPPTDAAKSTETASGEASAATSPGTEIVGSKVYTSSEEIGLGTQSHDRPASSEEIEGMITAGSVTQSHDPPQDMVRDETPPALTEHASESQSDTNHTNHASMDTLSEHTVGAKKPGTSGTLEAKPTPVHSDVAPASSISSTRPKSEETKAPEPQHASKTSKIGGHGRS